MVSAEVGDPVKVDAAFDAVKSACSLRGIAVVRMQESRPTILAVELTGATRNWPLFIDCDEAHLRLPWVATKPPTTPLAHVSYSGAVCIDDGQGLSLDPSRPAEIVAHAALKAYDLLEESAVDAATGYGEFFNELEGYWLHLPGSLRSRAYFEVDGKSRMVKGFVNSRLKTPNWYFVEPETDRPRDVRQEKLAGQRALYVHLDALELPPAKPNKLTTAFIDAVHQQLTPEQLNLWNQLLGPSKNSPKQLALLVSAPRQAGGLSLVAAVFTARGGGIDKSASVTPLTMRRHAPQYMRERGGSALELSGKHVAVLGAGAVGSVVVDTLAAAGVRNLTVVDHDEYSADNVFRHLLEPIYIDISKPVGLKLALERRYPGLSITPVTSTAQKWWKTADLRQYDGIVFAFGAPSVERSFSRVLKGGRQEIPVVFTWLEAMDLGGHSVLMWTKGDGCLDCAYRDDEGLPSQASRTSFLEPNQPVTRNLTGCAGAFVPFGPIQARKTGLLAAEHLLSAMTWATAGDDARRPSYRFWVGEGTAAAKQGLRTTPWFQAARTTSYKEATRMVFGRPCLHCRAPKEPSP
ncbi:ThiF family adenylyltransferase [Limnohabitans parvus]|uniref:THIF-type NAD/FAD binding fold domain-containing protein n=1 Tax=Limnohabitans parvus II-B4 TaxID=1293052 RepID=A0A315EEE8_9BURK|nr:ThiF family adenylyltransferase [Limnohabitans parvus]PUE55671.1 hypothetical protein B9Z37_03775 [Limnohabitans parvus II-B4]